MNISGGDSPPVISSGDSALTARISSTKSRWHDQRINTLSRMPRFRNRKKRVDEVFVQLVVAETGLIIAQWNHSDFSQINGDERCLLPGELWGRQDYLS